MGLKAALLYRICVGIGFHSFAEIDSSATNLGLLFIFTVLK